MLKIERSGMGLVLPILYSETIARVLNKMFCKLFGNFRNWFLLIKIQRLKLRIAEFSKHTEILNVAVGSMFVFEEPSEV